MELAQPSPAETPFGGELERRPRLLVVDDQPVNVQLLYRVFAADHQVFAATEGNKALEIARQQQPDLILLDVVMPELDGFEVCRRLKSDELTRDIPVIFLTANADPDSEAHGLDVGAVDFIGKPFNTKVVRARVKTHVTLKRQGDLLRRWVFLDGLTGIANRRQFDASLEREWESARGSQLPLSLLLFDVDFFKQFNDLYGHVQGDKCLTDIAQTLNLAAVGPRDVVARFGGEEFVILLPETDAIGAQRVAKRCQRLIEKRAITHAQSPHGQLVTASIGLGTVMPNDRMSTTDFLQAVDRQLYAAKQNGRNRIETVAL